MFLTGLMEYSSRYLMRNKHYQFINSRTTRLETVTQSSSAVVLRCLTYIPLFMSTTVSLYSCFRLIA